MVRLVEGTAQHYAWGDREAIPAILGRPADDRPFAEWWWGTHPGAPATIVGDGPLRDVSGELPYLLKLLAAAAPLSLQTHPSTAQAEEGFAREEAAGIAVDDAQRIYRDRSAKPELLCALTPFDALCGFAPVGVSVARLQRVGESALADRLRTDGLKRVVRDLYAGRLDPAPVIAACAASDDPAATLVTALDGQYPGEPSVAVTLLLNRVLLAPGEAIFLGPGNLHAYLSGTGVEVMAASDNVVRGGLTPKHVDVDELLRVLDIAPLADPVVHPEAVGERTWAYPTPGSPFAVWRHETPLRHTAETRELLLCVEGDGGTLHRGQCAYLAPGESVTLDGPATVFRVAEPELDT